MCSLWVSSAEIPPTYTIKGTAYQICPAGLMCSSQLSFLMRCKPLPLRSGRDQQHLARTSGNASLSPFDTLTHTHRGALVPRLALMWAWGFRTSGFPDFPRGSPRLFFFGLFFTNCFSFQFWFLFHFVRVNRDKLWCCTSFLSPNYETKIFLGYLFHQWAMVQQLTGVCSSSFS